jgi:hypothetical protein
MLWFGPAQTLKAHHHHISISAPVPFSDLLTHMRNLIKSMETD